MRRWLEPSLVLLAALSVAGCSDDKGGGTKTAAPKHEHPPAPHGGEVVEVGEEVAHLELIHDHAGGKVTVYVLGVDLKTPVAVEAPVINVNGKSGPVQLTLTAVNPGADGKADTWKGEHEALKTDPWDGRIRVKIDGKTYNSDLEPEGAHAHGEEFVPPAK